MSDPEPTPSSTLDTHILALPPFLLPLAPSLAALHHARIKLALTPSMASGQVRTVAAVAALRELELRMKREAKGWCLFCGAIRERVDRLEGGGGTEGVEMQGAERGKKRRRGGYAAGAVKRSEGGGLVSEEVVGSGGQVERERDSSSFLLDPPAGTPPLPTRTTTTPTSTPGTPPRTLRSRRYGLTCDACGASSSRTPVKSIPKLVIPSARVLRKRPSSAGLGSVGVGMGPSRVVDDVPSASSSVSLPPPGSNVTDVFSPRSGTSTNANTNTHTASTIPTDMNSPAAANTPPTTTSVTPPPSSPIPPLIISRPGLSAPTSTSTTAAPATTSSASSHLPRPPAITARHAPSLKYIPHTDPSPPTYPEPKVSAINSDTSTSLQRPSTSPSATQSPSLSRSQSPSQAQSQPQLHSATTARKKTKKSGLAKLLAQSKEREAGGAGGAGNWGLG